MTTDKNKKFVPSIRANVITRRTYNRPLDDEGTVFETWEQTVDRVIRHQTWLWETAKGSELSQEQKDELQALRKLMIDRSVMCSGRTLWLGDTSIARSISSSQFNCASTRVKDAYDVVDCFWLLLQGCGVGFIPVTGCLTGFFKPIEKITVVRSTRKDKGREDNIETYDKDTGVWKISIGDSARAWAKSIGKLLVGKYPAKELILDFSEIRPSGYRLKGYGWISSGDGHIANAYKRIVDLLNDRSGSLLSKIDIMDILNHLGTVLSSRRSAEICQVDYGSAEWREFAVAKRDFWLHGNEHRQQSNNSLMFWSKPSKEQLEEVFDIMLKGGGSEPGMINAEAATKRAPWFSGVNPCAEILLPDSGFCNLFEVSLPRFYRKAHDLHEALRLAARANYRQTCVDFNDGILQEKWNLINNFLHLCGVGITGVAMRPDLTEYDYRQMRNCAVNGAYSMADELGLPRPKNVTTLKPSGTLSKIMGSVDTEISEGVHKPLGKYIFNNVNFSVNDPLIPKLKQAGYNVFNHPTDSSAVLVTFPVKYDGIQFDEVNGVEVNTESAVAQLERYKLLQTSWCDQNVSITVSYSPDEVPSIIDWLLHNWDIYVGVSFIIRTDPTKTAKDLGYLYLPQEVVTKETYDAYVAKLGQIDIDSIGDGDLIDDACSTGACPVR